MPWKAKYAWYKHPDRIAVRHEEAAAALHGRLWAAKWTAETSRLRTRHARQDSPSSYLVASCATIVPTQEQCTDNAEAGT